MLNRFKTLILYGLYLLSVATLALIIGGSERTFADTDIDDIRVASPSNADWDEIELINDLEDEEESFEAWSERMAEAETDDTGISFRIPASVSLSKDGDGSYSGNYEVEVLYMSEGDRITILPEVNEVELKQENKGSVIAYIEQDKHEFSFDGDFQSSGRIYVDEDLSAGIWTGSFSFSINQEKAKAKKRKLASPSDAEPVEDLDLEEALDELEGTENINNTENEDLNNESEGTDEVGV